MASKKTEAVTPKGTAIWPRLNTPDTKFDPAGKYTCKIAVPGDDEGLAALRKQTQELIDEKFDEVVAKLKEDGKGAVAKKVSKADPFVAEEDPETGEETGNILINAKMTASGTSRKTGKPWSRKPAIFDAKGKKLSNPPIIGGGSEVKLSVELFPYFAANDKTVGVSFRLEAVQVLKLVSSGNRDAGGYGFEEEDGDELEDMEDTTFGGSEGGDAEDDEDFA
ncbi:hypothetical protein QQS45_08315 [Alteriqipengyuania flavescens]|uniref:hypothetical protein n=1 Tax=Alteriqipengyuania flavescens TaxID=3053610 RepID=UPI0025B57087|nr:hypothetical protein [Alteriqipengyuania flavescens]WJY17651.1 hypothetical protein QQW98_08310 [Alteriqipengyuania flavescens]WJY23594.1 hypothetical protein QQS45_08315 [Alteriqipengyuania flavescens]